jgi:Zn-dependent peptidase ImmA (M78 family)
VITKEKVFKNIYITLNEANKVLDFKVTIDKKAEEYRELKAYYETLNEANLYKRFSIGLKNKIKNKIIITRSEDFQKVFYFMKRDKKYIIIKKGDVYRLTINKKIVKIEKIKEEETELGYLLF